MLLSPASSSELEVSLLPCRVKQEIVTKVTSSSIGPGVKSWREPTPSSTNRPLALALCRQGVVVYYSLYPLLTRTTQRPEKYVMDTR